MKILINGHRGYIGPVLAKHIREAHPDWTIHGNDADWFRGCHVAPYPDDLFDRQSNVDVRDLDEESLSTFDAVIQLAAVSNDPMGKEFEGATNDINAAAALRVAELAKKSGVSKFVFASSCSMYGAGDSSFRKETDTLNPLTAYAKSKVAVEQGLTKYAGDGFQVTSLRFATACGASPMLRLDLVLNDFVATAARTGAIEVLSDGSPWRPLVHVKDMSRAIEWACLRDGEDNVEVNVGSQEWTWQIGQLAKDVAEILGGVEVSINTDAAPDKRSYRVNFEKFASLAPDHLPNTDFEAAVRSLETLAKGIDFGDKAVRDTQYIRLNVLRSHLDAKKLTSDLRWSANA